MLISVPEHVDTLVIHLPVLAKAERLTPERRIVYFETSREGSIDREGEDIAADALWASRRLFLEQGNLDINHFSWLGNPPGSGMAPQYVVGHPVDVKRKGKSIYVAGELFTNHSTPPEDSNGVWADRLWHSLTQVSPPMKWFPSVFGKMDPDGIKMETRRGKTVRFVTGPMEWWSVGFAQRVQHPELGPLTLSAEGTPFAKASMGATNVSALPKNIRVLDYQTFAKSVVTAGVMTAGEGDVPSVRRLGDGVPAIRYESLDPTLRRAGNVEAGLKHVAVNTMPLPNSDVLYLDTRKEVVVRLMQGRIEGSRRGLVAAFRQAGAGSQSSAFAKRLMAEVDTLP